MSMLDSTSVHSGVGPANGHTSKLNARGNPVMDQHPIQGRVEILLVVSYRNQDKLRPDEPLGLYADL